MRKGYSKLLIQDFVLPEKGCLQIEAILDLYMVITTGMERTEKQWRDLLSSVGFGIVKIWPAQVGSMSIIETEPI